MDDPDSEAKLAEVDGALAELAGLVHEPSPVGAASGASSGEKPVRPAPPPGSLSTDENPAAIPGGGNGPRPVKPRLEDANDDIEVPDVEEA